MPLSSFFGVNRDSASQSGKMMSLMGGFHYHSLLGMCIISFIVLLIISLAAHSRPITLLFQQTPNNPRIRRTFRKTLNLETLTSSHSTISVHCSPLTFDHEMFSSPYASVFSSILIPNIFSAAINGSLILRDMGARMPLSDIFPSRTSLTATPHGIPTSFAMAL